MLYQTFYELFNTTVSILQNNSSRQQETKVKYQLYVILSLNVFQGICSAIANPYIWEDFPDCL